VELPHTIEYCESLLSDLLLLKATSANIEMHTQAVIIICFIFYLKFPFFGINSKGVFTLSSMKTCLEIDYRQKESTLVSDIGNSSILNYRIRFNGVRHLISAASQLKEERLFYFNQR
jgi:hypothetical protein